MNKVAIITGGGSGLGFSMAQRFVKEGVTTIIVGRNPEKLEEATNQLGTPSSYEVCDLADLESIPGLIKKINEEHGRIDILVNNAGIHQKKLLEEVTDEEYQDVIRTNQTSVFSISRETAKYMSQQGNGVILNISSMASQYGIPGVISYTSAKSAIEGMTRAMAVELSPKGIRVNCLAPGFILTQMSAKALNNDTERKNKVLGRTPMRKLGEPGDVANAAWFLCSDEAKYITGVILPVDGGNTIGF